MVLVVKERGERNVIQVPAIHQTPYNVTGGVDYYSNFLFNISHWGRLEDIMETNLT